MDRSEQLLQQMLGRLGDLPERLAAALQRQPGGKDGGQGESKEPASGRATSTPASSLERITSVLGQRLPLIGEFAQGMKEGRQMGDAINDWIKSFSKKEPGAKAPESVPKAAAVQDVRLTGPFPIPVVLSRAAQNVVDAAGSPDLKDGDRKRPAPRDPMGMLGQWIDQGKRNKAAGLLPGVPARAPRKVPAPAPPVRAAKARAMSLLPTPTAKQTARGAAPSAPLRANKVKALSMVPVVSRKSAPRALPTNSSTTPAPSVLPTATASGPLAGAASGGKDLGELGKKLDNVADKLEELIKAMQRQGGKGTSGTTGTAPRGGFVTPVVKVSTVPNRPAPGASPVSPRAPVGEGLAARDHTQGRGR